MTLTLEIPNELGEQIERAAQERGTDARGFLLQAAQKELDPDASLDALLETMVDHRARLGLPPLTDAQVSRAAFYDEEEG